MVSTIEDAEERAKFIRQNAAILKTVVAGSFNPNSRHSSESTNYSVIVKDMQEKYGVDSVQITDIVLTEYVQAVQKMCRITNLSTVEKYRRRRWLLGQGKRWGMDVSVLNLGMNKHGGDTWCTTVSK